MERFNVAYDMLNAKKRGVLVDWWKEVFPNKVEKYPWRTRSELPDKKPEQMSGQVEIIGLSGSGKSKFIEYAKKRFSPSNVIIRPELFLRDERGLQEDLSHGSHSQKMQELMAAEFGRINQVRTWNRIKLISHLQGEVGQLRSPGKANLIIERGANDALATDDFTRPEHYRVRYDPIFENRWLELIFFSLTLGQRVDAVILFETTWEKTQKRRIAAGLEPEGKYINSKNWPQILLGYEFWLGSFYTLFRKAQGMGLLIIDGTANLEENNIKAIKFCEEVFAMGRK